MIAGSDADPLWRLLLYPRLNHILSGRNRHRHFSAALQEVSAQASRMVPTKKSECRETSKVLMRANMVSPPCSYVPLSWSLPTKFCRRVVQELQNLAIRHQPHVCHRHRPVGPDCLQPTAYSGSGSNQERNGWANRSVILCRKEIGWHSSQAAQMRLLVQTRTPTLDCEGEIYKALALDFEPHNSKRSHVDKCHIHRYHATQSSHIPLDCP